ncbi:MAG: TRAM domain-containing protein, partial [Candidatus Cloacimonetes bacterium]|nr:TRAM domain-containing protein [Candidatus Cloacimonadota bacterium]
FEATLSAMREIEFDYAFCFKYSEREGTAAAKYPDQLPEEIRLSRLQRMIELQREITLRIYRAQIGKEIEVYVEDFSKKSKSQVSGKTRDFKIAVLDGDESQIGTLAKAKVIDATAGTLICE